jgi:hypothetical protein
VESELSDDSVINFPWRVGGNFGRNVYAITDPQSDGTNGRDTEVAKFDHSVVAKHIVWLHNTYLDSVPVGMEMRS